MIDRSVASREWSELFPNVLVKHAPCIILDHYPIVVDIEGRIGKKLQKAKKRFKFEAMWANEEECAEIIKAIWKVNGDASFGEKLTGLQLLQWHDTKFKGLRREIDILTKEIHSSSSRVLTYESLLEEQSRRETLNTLLEKEEIF